jgi:GT2 family glycosyltransferase
MPTGLSSEVRATTHAQENTRLVDRASPEGCVSVVIVNFNGINLLLECLRSVYAQSYPAIEVIVVDNGSTDASVATVRRLYPAVAVIENTVNVGFAEANNQGVRRASGEIVVLLNNDTEVQEGWMEGLIEMLKRPGVGAVTSKVITNGVPERFYELNGTVNFLGYNIMRHFHDTERVFFGGGASLAFRKSVVPRPFLREYFLYHEDVFLSWLLRLRGYDIRMAPTSIVTHVGSATTRRQRSHLVTFYQERNRLLNALLLYSGKTLLLLSPWLVLDACAKLFASAVGRGKSLPGILRAYLWVPAHISWLRSVRKDVQAQRVVPDRTILALMSSKVLEGEGRTTRFANRISGWYAAVTGLIPHA